MKKLTHLKLERKAVLSGLHLVMDSQAKEFYKAWLAENRKIIVSILRSKGK